MIMGVYIMLSEKLKLTFSIIANLLDRIDKDGKNG